MRPRRGRDVGREGQTRRRNYIVWIHASYHRETFSKLRYGGGCLVTSVIRRADTGRATTSRAWVRKAEDGAERCGEKRREFGGACHLCLGVYLGRDMKNASNGPRGTSPFKSTAILLPTCHHFSDQKLPARVTFPCAVYPATPTHTTTTIISTRRPLPPPGSTPSVQEKPLPTSPLNKARETLLHTGASPAYVFTRCDVRYVPTWAWNVLRVRRAVTPTDSYVDYFRGFNRISVSVAENGKFRHE